MGSRRGSIRRLPSGSYQIRYVGLDGRRYAETIGPDAKAAERALTARLGELDTGRWREPSGETLKEYGERWMERRRPRLARSTAVGYASYLKNHVYPALGHRPLSTLRPVDFDDFAAKLERDGRAPATVRAAMVAVRAMLSDAVRHGLLPANPAARVDLPPAPGPAGRDLPAEHSTAIRAALVELAPEDPFRPGGRDMVGPLAFDVAIGTGLRWSELAALRWRAIDFDRRTILVEEAIVLGQSKRPKSGKARTVPMFESVQRALRELAARALDRGRYAPAELVLGNLDGRPLDPQNWGKRVWQPALEKAGLGGHVEDAQGRKVWKGVYRWHDLRHAAVSRLVEQGADIAVAQAVAGHSSAATTLKIYTHLRDDRIERAAREFDPGHVRGTDSPVVADGGNGAP